jgi:hypothetical protein
VVHHLLDSSDYSCDLDVLRHAEELSALKDTMGDEMCAVARLSVPCNLLLLSIADSGVGDER